MTTPHGDFVGDVAFAAYLPEPLPGGQAVKDAARDYETYATIMDTVYQDTNTTWGGLSSVMTIPEPEQTSVLLALRNNVEPLGAALGQGLEDLRKAMDAFGDSLLAFRTTHDALKRRVEAFNALPSQEYSLHQKAVAAEEGASLPTTQSWAVRNALVSDLRAAQSTYEAYIETCVSGIEAATPTVLTDGPKNLATSLGLVKGAYGVATTWVDRGASFRGAGRGRLRFVWSADNASLSRFIHEGVPGWKSVHDPDAWMNRFLPDAFKDRIPDASRFAGLDQVKAMDAWYAQRIDNLARVSETLGKAALTALPAPVLRGLDRIKNSKYGRFLSVNTVKNHNGRTRVEFNVGNRRLPVSEKIRSQMGRFDTAKGYLDKIGESRIVKHGGRALGLLDTAATYYDSYGKNYNEELRNNPAASEDDLRNAALASTAVEGTAETAGKVAGGVVGRAAGAAVGQALIPIPGVGAAVGGVVGGIAGEWVGGKIGAGVGEFINDWRQGGADQALGDAGKAISNAGSTLVEGAKDIGKDLGKKLFGWG